MGDLYTIDGDLLKGPNWVWYINPNWSFEYKPFEGWVLNNKWLFPASWETAKEAMKEYDLVEKQVRIKDIQTTEEG